MSGTRSIIVCRPPAPLLRKAPVLLADYLANLYNQGLPSKTPILITEYGYSAFSTEVEMDVPGALFNADVLGTFLTVARSPGAAYMYGLDPTPLYKGPDCDTWGNNTLFLCDKQRNILARTATYYEATMLTRQWVGNPAQPHQAYPVKVEPRMPGRPSTFDRLRTPPSRRVVGGAVGQQGSGAGIDCNAYVLPVSNRMRLLPWKVPVIYISSRAPSIAGRLMARKADQRSAVPLRTLHGRRAPRQAFGCHPGH